MACNIFTVRSSINFTKNINNSPHASYHLTLPRGHAGQLDIGVLDVCFSLCNMHAWGMKKLKNSLIRKSGSDHLVRQNYKHS